MAIVEGIERLMSFTASGTLTTDTTDILDFDVGDGYLVTCEDADNAIVLYSLSSFGTYKNWFMFPKACNRINCDGDYALILSSDDTKVYFFQISTCSIIQIMDLKGSDIIAFAYSFPYLMTTFVDSSTSFTQVIKNNFININVS